MITLVRLRADRFKGLRDVDLVFPQQGSVLIEGHNESGKSTLFEAIYAALYGKPLVGEDESRPKLEDLIAFGGDGGWVELTFATTTAQICVHREFARGKGQTASITVRRDGAADEMRHGTTAVNDRILRELGNLDGDTLRNSCFVEQKELERLESLSRQEREKAIERLLGLERLTQLANYYRQEGKDLQKQLGYHEKLTEIARARATIVEMQAAIDRAHEMIDAITARTLIAERDALHAQFLSLAAQIDALTTEQHHLEERVARVAAIEEWLRESDDLTRALSQAQTLRAAVAMSATERLARRDDILTHELPAAEQRLVLLEKAQAASRQLADSERQMADARSRLEQAQQRRDAVERARDDRAAMETRLRAAEAEADAAFTSAQAAASLHHDAELRDALEAWLRTASLATTAADFHRHEEQLQADYAAVSQRAALAKARLRMATIIAVIGAAIALGGLTFAGLSHIPLIGSLAIIIGLLGSTPLYFTRSAAQRASTELQEAQMVLRAAQERREGARLAGADPALLAKQQATLAQLGVTGDMSQDEARRLHDDLARRVTITAHEARDQAQRTAIAAATARQQVDSIRQALTSPAPDDDDQAAAQALADAEHAARQAEAAWQEAYSVAQIESTAASLPAGAGEVTIAGERARTEQEIAQLRRQAESLAAEQGDTRRHDLETLLSAIAARWNGLCAHAVERGIWADALTDDLVPMSYSPSQNERQVQETSLAVGDALLANLAPRLDHASAWMRAEMDRLDGAAAQRERDRLIGQIGELRQQCEHVGQSATERNTELVILMAKRRIELPQQREFSREALIERWPPLAGAEGDRELLVEQVRDAENRRFAAEEKARVLIDEMALTPETVATLDVATCAATVAGLRRQIEIGRRAVEIVNQGRQQIVRQVLPTTERNMRVILPLLTAGRYHDVRLTAPESPDGEIAEVDYRIRVWDQAARRYVGKAIFSGGARDQCSLALRLAFALATLPQELGVAPGFLFLDEPLSAFDGERASALVELLTRGHIARAFAQIFVISHAHAFAREDFRYHVRMDRGRIADCDLPTSAEVAVSLAIPAHT